MSIASGGNMRGGGPKTCGVAQAPSASGSAKTKTVRAHIAGDRSKCHASPWSSKGVTLALSSPLGLDVRVQRRPPRKDPRDVLVDALREAYARLDAVLEPFSCDLSTDCCHFERTGREPWVTDVEWTIVAKALGALGGRDAVAAKNRRTLPIVNEGRCPLLGADGRCSVYSARPLGCRTFFCDRVQGPGRVPRDAVRDALREVQRISEQFSPTSPTGRPLRQRF